MFCIPILCISFSLHRKESWQGTCQAKWNLSLDIKERNPSLQSRDGLTFKKNQSLLRTKSKQIKNALPLPWLTITNYKYTTVRDNNPSNDKRQDYKVEHNFLNYFLLLIMNLMYRSVSYSVVVFFSCLVCVSALSNQFLFAIALKGNVLLDEQ